MRSIDVVDPEAVTAALDAVESALAALTELGVHRAPRPLQLVVLERLETLRRRGIALSHEVIGLLATAQIAELGGQAQQVIADRLRITPTQARHRIRDAGQLAPRITLIGQPLPPELAATATRWRAGMLDGEHLRAIQRFCTELPVHIDGPTRTACEEFLADKATLLRPDQLVKVAARLATTVNPDGTFSDVDRARRRGFSWGPQGPDGMSHARLVATPELRAYLEAWFARFAAPGRCDPADQTPVVNGEPTQEAAQRDARSAAQRQHDALSALVRGQLGNPALGQHNGLPVAVIVSTTLQELQSACGQAVTGGGTLLPMPDLIRMASHAHHYLAIFDQHSTRPLYLGRTRRTASPDQRIILHAKDRGCTRPGCTAPGYHCQVHHVEDWRADGQTNVDTLTFACTPDHHLLDHGWTTRKLPDGTTQWIPPPHLDTGQPRINDYHHPERYLTDQDGEED
jgi:hypothetical protein